jgi:hypothetical protein
MSTAKNRGFGHFLGILGTAVQVPTSKTGPLPGRKISHRQNDFSPSLARKNRYFSFDLRMPQR